MTHGYGWEMSLLCENMVFTHYKKKMQANLNYPQCVFVSNDEVFIADFLNDRVRKILRNGDMVTIAGNGSLYSTHDCDGQLATNVPLQRPNSVFVSSSNQVYISECYGHRIRKIDSHGMITTIAGTGIAGFNGDGQLAVTATIDTPCGLFVTDEEEVLFGDQNNNRLRKIDRCGIISTLVCDVYACSVTMSGNDIYMADLNDQKIKVLRNGQLITIAGSGKIGFFANGQPALNSPLNSPCSVRVYNGHIFMVDQENHCVRTILPNGTIKTIAGNGTCGYNGDGMLATHAQLNFPADCFVDDLGIYIADEGNSRIRKVDWRGVISTIGGTGVRGFAGDVEFDFEKYPHVGSGKKKRKPTFPHAYHDVIVKTSDLC